MDWLQSLLWDPSSVAHIVLLYAFVVAAGVYLGKSNKWRTKKIKNEEFLYRFYARVRGVRIFYKKKFCFNLLVIFACRTTDN